MKRAAVSILAIVLAVVVFSPSARADEFLLGFATGNAGSGGTITVNGRSFVGANIPIDVMTADTVQGPIFERNWATYDLSGTATSSNQDANLSALLSFKFDPISGGGFSIVGGAVGLAGVPNSFTLLTGGFDFRVGVDQSDTNLKLTFTGGSFNPNSQMRADLSALCKDCTPEFGFFNVFPLTIEASRDDDSSPWVVTNTTIVNRSTPEPSSVFLLATGLMSSLGLLKFRSPRKR